MVDSCIFFFPCYNTHAMKFVVQVLSHSLCLCDASSIPTSVVQQSFSMIAGMWDVFSDVSVVVLCYASTGQVFINVEVA